MGGFNRHVFFGAPALVTTVIGADARAGKGPAPGANLKHLTKQASEHGSARSRLLFVF